MNRTSTTASSWSSSRPSEAALVFSHRAVGPIDIEVATPAELLRRHYPNGRLGGLSVEGPLPGALGTLVDLRVRTLTPARSFELKGQLAWARHAAGRGLKESFGVDLVEGGDGARRLIAFAQEALQVEATRAESRVPVSLPVKVLHLGQVRHEVLADLSLGGAYIRSQSPLNVGEPVELHFRPRLALLALTIEGRVAWTQTGGKDSGMGVQFGDLEPRQYDRLSKLVRELLGS